MAKSKRKSSRRKASPERIRQAQYAKQHGLLSKRANLNGGRISRGVASKLAQLEDLRAVPTYELREGQRRASVLDKPKTHPVKLGRGMVREAKSRGYPVFNGHLVSDHPKDAAKAIAEGRLAGAAPAPGPMPQGDGVRRVTKNRVERINLRREGINNFADLKEALAKHELEDRVKLPNEIYTFTLFDYHPNPTRTIESGSRGKKKLFHSDAMVVTSGVFYTDEELLEYMQAYQVFNEDEDDIGFREFELYRMEEGGTIGRTPDWVYDRHRKQGTGGLRAKRIQEIKARAKALKDRRQAQTREEEKIKDRSYQYLKRQAETPAQTAERNRKKTEYMRKQREKGRFK